MLMKQQDRIDDRVQDIEEQLYKLESDKRQVEVKKKKDLIHFFSLSLVWLCPYV